jgi:hypothetical protein
MYIFLVLLTSLAFGKGWDTRSVGETTYTRDNSYCKIGLQKIEFQIRSDAFLSEPKEKKYGEYIFFYPDETPKLLPLNHDKMHNYRLFEGKSALCSKSFGYSLGSDKVAILFLKENSPDMDKLAFQILNTKTLAPEDVIDTEYMTDMTEAADNGFLFRTYEQRDGLEMGKTHIHNVEYIFQTRNFPIWMKYSSNGFEISGSASYQKFQWKNYFKSEKDFFENSVWDNKEKKFKNSILYFAVNHALKKECILLAANKIQITGTESGWRCN